MTYARNGLSAGHTVLRAVRAVVDLDGALLRPRTPPFNGLDVSLWVPRAFCMGMHGRYCPPSAMLPQRTG